VGGDHADVIEELKALELYADEVAADLDEVVLVELRTTELDSGRRIGRPRRAEEVAGVDVGVAHDDPEDAVAEGHGTARLDRGTLEEDVEVDQVAADHGAGRDGRGRQVGRVVVDAGRRDVDREWGRERSRLLLVERADLGVALEHVEVDGRGWRDLNGVASRC
jgi:hypothetical protein